MAATTVLESTLNSKGFLSSDEDSGFLAGATMALPQLMKALGTTSSTYTGSGCTIKKREAILAPLFLTRLTALHSSLFSKNNISASFSISNIRHVSIDSVWVSFGPPRIVNSSILLGARNLERINDNTLLREFKGYRILRSFSLEYAYKEDDDSSDEDQGPNVDRLQHAMTEGVVLAVDVELDCDVTSKLEQHQQQGKSASTTETTTTTTTTTTLLDKTESRLLRVRFETQNLKKRDMPDKAVWRVADVDNYLLTELADDLDAKISKIKPVVKGDE